MTTVTAAHIAMPPMGVSVEEGTLVAWHVAVGDQVLPDQIVCDISTDKVETELSAGVSGVVAELLVQVGETVPVGAPMARIDVGADPELVTSLPADSPAITSPDASPPASSPPASLPAASTLPAASPPASPPVADGPGHPLAGAILTPAAAAQRAIARVRQGGGPPISPVARRLAADHRIEVAHLSGSGYGGRITKADVQSAIESAVSTPALPAPAAAPPAAPPGSALVGGAGPEPPPGYADVPCEILATSRHRRLVAEHMVRSLQTAAHMTTQVDVDMTRVATARAQINAERLGRGESKLSFLPFITRAAVCELANFPDLNATFLDDYNIRWREVNVGIAVDAPDGLIAPIIRDAERLTVGALSDQIAQLADKARSRALTADDLRAGTFTITNVGSVGGVECPAIINQPQVAILGVPAIVRRPWVVLTADGEDVIVARPIMRLAITYDHRAVDGAYATRYIAAVRDHLERWTAGDYR